MSAQHTPGPWAATEASGLVVDAGGTPVAVTSGLANGPAAMEYRANARLIAAAPDLLNSLREAMSAVEVFHGPIAWDIFRDHAPDAPEMKRWLAAIAKATGGQP